MANNAIPNPGCENCEDGKIRTPQKPIGWTFEYCDCYVEVESLKYTRKLLEHSGIIGRLVTKYSVANWKEPGKITFELLLELITSEDLGKNWLFLHGSSGTGKTFAAMIAAQIALLQEKSVYFAPVPELLESLRPKTISENQQEEDQHEVIWYKLKQADVLILDDIGHEKASQWVREQIYIIVNNRWNSGKITIFTSNFKMENLRTNISEAVYSRIRGDSLSINLSSEDMRYS